MVRFVAAVTLLCATVSYASGAHSKAEIRFYKINKVEQTDRIWFTRKKARKPGCHNFLKKTRVFKAVQYRFEACTLYKEKNCAAGAEIPVTRDKDTTPTTILTQGFGWLTTPPTEADNQEQEGKRKSLKKAERGVRIRSWSCK